MYTNKYIFIYASVMVIVVAAILSTAATVLKPLQVKNENVAKMMAILKSANVEADASNAEELYARYIRQELVLKPNGDVISSFEVGKPDDDPSRAFYLDLKKELDIKHSGGKDYRLPLFKFENGDEKLLIIPLRGRGLWGPIWGHIAIKDDFRTVAGASFGHKGETPGLGAEISLPLFMDQFPGKEIFDDSGDFTSISVVKGGVESSPIPVEHGVDAITGGTITSDGVSAMLEDCLENYVPYFQKQI